jgi:hypothetical protein
MDRQTAYPEAQKNRFHRHGSALPVPVLALELFAKKRQKELEKRGIRSELLREEPFTTAQDSIEFKMHLMIWEKGILNRKARIETWEDQ